MRPKCRHSYISSPAVTYVIALCWQRAQSSRHASWLATTRISHSRLRTLCLWFYGLLQVYVRVFTAPTIDLSCFVCGQPHRAPSLAGLKFDKKMVARAGFVAMLLVEAKVRGEVSFRSFVLSRLTPLSGVTTVQKKIELAQLYRARSSLVFLSATVVRVLKSNVQFLGKALWTRSFGQQHFFCCSASATWLFWKDSSVLQNHRTPVNGASSALSLR